MPPLSTLISAACLLLAGPVLSQGSDTCATAQSINGLGSFSFDNTNATLDGASDPLCDFFGQSDIERDVWFAWTAPADLSVLVRTCAQTTVDTKIAVYAGGCGSPAIACNDDACGLQTEVSFSATSGATYLLRVGTFPGAAGGAGTFEIADDSPLLNPANGNHYRSVSGTYSWDQARANAEAETFMGVQGHLVTIADPAENDFVFNNLPGAPLIGYWIGLYQDMGLPGYSEPAGGWVWVTGEAFGFANWASGEPNDSQGGSEHWAAFFWDDQWNDNAPGGSPLFGYVVEFDTGGGLGTSYCTGAANSTGSGAQMSASGSASVSANDLVLEAGPVPNQPGIFFYGPSQVQIPFGNGFRCVGGTVGRLGVSNASGNVLTWNLDVTQPPNGGTVITPGSTWNFQAWFRDPPAGGSFFNLSNGLTIGFTP